ncbi:uncharacterized protein LOC107841591 [Capsicum annuum]|uniref:uncharacterized protein LOC107841591 n=1 Tax=Capsicum annuum TaxID=4072 RepID=UPI001FB11A3A|nr:uncharacterized protein LOC107841591 [Capsicum annuum]
MNCIIWNTGGANNAEFKRHCKAMIEMHKPIILALLETRMGDHNKLAEDLGFSNKIQYPTVGTSRGLVIMWNDHNISINDINISPQGIHTTVHVSNPPSYWYFSAIYVSNHFQDKKVLWNQLTDLSDTINNDLQIAWLVGGDFNEILSSFEKFGRNNFNSTRASHFWDCINQSNLIDLGFRESKFT